MAVATIRTWRLAVVLVPPGGRDATEALDDAWHLATREARQAVLGAELAREEGFYTTWNECHDAMLWLGAQLRV